MHLMRAPQRRFGDFRQTEIAHLTGFDFIADC